MTRALVPIVVLLFLLCKWGTVGARLSDTNIYILTARELLNGAVLYRDIVFTNAPLYPYIAIVYRFLAGGSLNMFYWAAPLEAVLIALVLWRILVHYKVRLWVILISVVSYLFSTTILATTDHSTGIFTAMLFAVLAYSSILKQRWWLSGFFLGAMLMTKGYTVPLAVGMGGYVLIRHLRDSWKVALTSAVTIGIVLVPTILLAFPQFLDQIFGYSLQRPTGIPKLPVFMFFLSRDWWIIVFAAIGLFWWRQTGKEWGIAMLAFVFLLVYRDVYYFYLNMTVPFLVLAGAVGTERLLHTKYPELVPAVTGGFAGLAILLNVTAYFGTFSTLQKIQDVSGLAKAVREMRAERIGGDADIMPAVAYEANVPRVLDILDTNATFFRTGRYSAESYTDAVLQGPRTALVMYAAEYPSYQVKEPVFSEVVNAERIMSTCTIVYSQPITAENMANLLHVWQCN